MGSPIVEPVITEVQVPPGMLGPDPATFEVRSFVVVGAGGIVLVDTGTPGSGEAIGSTLAALGANWTDVTDIVLTHSHFDHTGGLAESAELASQADVWAGAEDVSEIPPVGGRSVRSLAQGDPIWRSARPPYARAYARPREPASRGALAPDHRRPDRQR